ncbi:MAG: tRNA (adenosine(37)-N6)-dimethylallyltransferase MiaA [Polyangiaceae bacterium]|jgi:tRNA dimethylallyltransferase
MISSGASVVERVLGQWRPDCLLTVVGPTASGKTALAVALSERIGGEIVSADSIQVYRHFDIGSGKPSREELARAPHHLVSAMAPLEPIDAAGWSALATRAIADVRARGRIPVVCGGTFLWIKALLFGLADAPAGNAAMRENFRRIAEIEGRAALHARLRAVDPASAERLHPNDFVRVSRALEVYELTSKPMSDWQREHGFASPRYASQLFGLAWQPAILAERIRARTAGWLASGWIEEVETLRERGFDDARAMRSVGYAEVRAMLAGELPRHDLETAIVRATRVFARRQATWLNHVPVTWMDASRDAQDHPS